MLLPKNKSIHPIRLVEKQKKLFFVILLKIHILIQGSLMHVENTHFGVNKLKLN